MKLPPGIDQAFEHIYLRGMAAGMEAAAELSDAFAEENFSMCYDTVLFDPIMSKPARQSRSTITAADVAKSNELMIDGAIHSAMGHAAQNIAEAIRTKKKKVKP